MGSLARSFYITKMFKGPRINIGPQAIITRNMAKKEDCFPPVCNLTVRKVDPGDTREKCRIINFIKDNMLQDDPLMIAAGMHRNEPDPGILEYYKSLFRYRNSLYCMAPTKEICGALVARRATRSTASELLRTSRGMTFEHTKNYMELLSMIGERTNVFNAFSVPEALSVEGLVVGRPFRRRGIAKLLLSSLTEMAAKEDYKLVRLISSNVYAARAAQSCSGMKLFYFKKPGEYLNDKGLPLIHDEPPNPHVNVEVYVYQVKPKEMKT